MGRKYTTLYHPETEKIVSEVPVSYVGMETHHSRIDFSICTKYLAEVLEGLVTLAVDMLNKPINVR